MCLSAVAGSCRAAADFFNELSMLYGTISELCTDASCPVMSAGDKWQYLWCDGVKIRKPMTVSAREYVDYLMTWVESQLNDENIFPIKFDAPFPKKSVASARCTRLPRRCRSVLSSAADPSACCRPQVPRHLCHNL